MWSGRRLTKIQATTRRDNVCAESWCGTPKGAWKEKQERTVEKPEIDNARRAKGMSSVDPEDGGAEKPSKREATFGDSHGGGNALQMETKKRLKKLWETVCESDESNKIQKTNHARTVPAHETTRKRLEPTLPKDHDDHRAERGYSSIGHCNLVHKFVPTPQTMKIPDAQAAVDKGRSSKSDSCLSVG